MMDWLTYTVLVLAGAAAGFIDAIAGGGGLISLPALLWAGLPVPVALGTNKLQSSCGTTLAVIHYTRNGLIQWRELRPAVLITFVASVTGVRAVTQMDRTLLEKLVPILLVGVAVYTAMNPQLGALRRKPVLGKMGFALIFGSLLGFYDGFFGPGTGSFWMLACVLTLGLSLRDATGTTKALNLASNLAALSAFAYSGLLRWDAGGAMIVGQLVGARVGSGLVVRNGAKIIRPIFIATALVLALRLAWLAFAP